MRSLFFPFFFIASAFVIVSHPVDCAADCITCENHDICIQCSNNTVLYNHKCISRCPFGFYPEYDPNSNYYCKKIMNPLSTRNPINLFKHYEVQDYSKKQYDVFPLFSESAIETLMVCLWAKPGNNMSKSDITYPLFILTSDLGTLPMNLDRPSFGIFIRNRTLCLQDDCGFLPFSKPSFQEDIWKKLCISYRKDRQIHILSGNLHEFESTYPYLSPKSLYLVPGYHLVYVGGCINCYSFPGKVSSLSLSTHPIIWGQPLDLNRFLYEGIHNVIAYYSASTFYGAEIIELIKNISISIAHGKSQRIGNRTLFSGHASLKIPLDISKGSIGIRFVSNFLFQSEEILLSCSYFGIYDETLGRLYAAVLEFSPQWNQYLIRNRKVLPIEEEIIHIIRLEDTLIIEILGSQPLTFNISNSPSLWMIIGAHEHPSGLQSCPFSIGDIVLVEGGFGSTVASNNVHVLQDKEHRIGLNNLKKGLSSLNSAIIPQDCPKDCISCDGLLCIQCSRKLVFNGDCVESCPGESQAESIQCIMPDLFSNASEASGCIAGYSKREGLCVKSCPSSFYSSFNQTLRTYECKKCPSGCRECSENECITCDEGYLFFRGTCLIECPEHYPRINGECMCPIGCIICNNTHCLDCELGWGFDTASGVCKNKCNLTRREDGELSCETCPPNCETCYDSEVCLRCKDGYMNIKGECLLTCPDETPYLKDNSCVQACPPMTYQDQHTCKPCSLNCFNCTNSTYCNECLPKLLSYNNQCTSHCPDNTWTSLEERKCINCTIPNCNRCYSKDYCAECKPEYLFSDGKCVEKCPGDAPFSWEGICIPACPTSFFYNRNECVESCPESTYPESNRCLPCAPGCLQCSSLTDCQACDPDHKLVQDRGFYTDCRSSCENNIVTGLNHCSPYPNDCLNYTVQFKKEICYQCRNDYEVETIQSNHNCLLCKLKPIYYSEKHTHLVLKDFISAFKPQFIFDFPFKCNSCDEHCAECSATGKCKKCHEGFYLNCFGSCSAECPQGYFKDPETRSCFKCMDECITCVSIDKCTSCAQSVKSFALDSSGSCIYKDPPATYKFKIPKLSLTFKDSRNSPKTFLLSRNYLIRELPTNITCEFCRMLKLLGEEHQVYQCAYCENQQNCGSLCLECDIQGRCLKCLGILKGLVPNGADCTCPPIAPHLDHSTLSCRSECPIGSFLLISTGECVETCLTESYFTKKLSIFTVGSHCVSECPEGMFPHVSYGIFDRIECIKHESLTLAKTIDVSVDLLGNLVFCPSENDMRRIENYFYFLEKEKYMALNKHTIVLDAMMALIHCRNSLERSQYNQLIDALHVFSPLCKSDKDISQFTKLTHKILSSVELIPEDKHLEALRLLIDHSRCAYYHEGNFEMELENGYFVRKSVFQSNTKVQIKDGEIYFNLKGFNLLIALGVWNQSMQHLIPNNIQILYGPLVITVNKLDEGSDDAASFIFSDAKDLLCFYFDSNLIWKNTSVMKSESQTFCRIQFGSILFVGKVVHDPISSDPLKTNFLGLILLIIVTIILILAIIMTKRRREKYQNIEVQAIELQEEEEANQSRDDEEEETKSEAHEKA